MRRGIVLAIAVLVLIAGAAPGHLRLASRSEAATPSPTATPTAAASGTSAGRNSASSTSAQPPTGEVVRCAVGSAGLSLARPAGGPPSICLTSPPGVHLANAPLPPAAPVHQHPAAAMVLPPPPHMPPPALPVNFGGATQIPASLVPPLTLNPPPPTAPPPPPPGPGAEVGNSSTATTPTRGLVGAPVTLDVFLPGGHPGQPVEQQTSNCAGTTPAAFLTSNPFYSTEMVSLIAEQQGSCDPTFFYYDYSTDGGQTYQPLAYGSGNYVGLSLSNWPVGGSIWWAVSTCDSACSPWGLLYSSAVANNYGFSFDGVHQWFYQNTGFAQGGGNEYIGIVQTPQPGESLANLTDAFTWIGGRTSNNTFYQVGYSVLSSGAMTIFAATNYQAQSYTLLPGCTEPTPGCFYWNGISCPPGATMDQFQPPNPPISVRCDIPVPAGDLNAQDSYWILSYPTAMYVGIYGPGGNTWVLESSEASSGSVSSASAVEEAAGQPSVNPRDAFTGNPAARPTGDLIESYFAGAPAIIPDYEVVSAVFYLTPGAMPTQPALCGGPGSLERETVPAPWGMRWDDGLNNC